MTVRDTVAGLRFEIALVIMVTLMPAASAAQGRGGLPPEGGGLQALEARVGTLEPQLEDLNAALSALSSQVGEQLTSLQQLVGQLHQDLAAAETKVADLERQLAALQGGGLTAYEDLADLPCVTAANVATTSLLVGPLKSAVCAVGISTNDRFVDLGPIIFDSQTNLMWEKKDDSGLLHDVDNTYAWCTPIVKGGVRDICTDISDSWIDEVNAESFAGFSDWRVPTEDELRSIVDNTAGLPRIDPIFGLTRATGYWTVEEDLVSFASSAGVPKPGGAHAVRAVRSLQGLVTPLPKPMP